MREPETWLAQHMHDRARVAEAEQELAPAVRAAIGEFLAAVRNGLALGQTMTAAATPPDDRAPDWAGFPDDSLWRRLVQQHIAPVWRQIWRRAYQQTAPEAPDGAGVGQADDGTEALTERLRTWPRTVWDRLRITWRDGLARGETPAALRARVAELATLEGWDGSATTMTRTETATALNAGAIGAALDEQTRTRRAWTKTWLATRDSRTRAEHRAADGQTRPLNEAFDIGGARLHFPGDPRGPAGLVINCRCAAQYRPATP
jgi:hypothetical protein